MLRLFSEQKRSGNLPLLCFNEKKAIQGHLLQKHPILSIQIEKIYDELTRHATVRMDLPILTADDQITRHKTFKVNIPCNGT